MHNYLLFIFCIFCSSLSFGLTAAKEITPYKYSHVDIESSALKYEIPESSRFTIARKNENSPNIIYYFSSPKNESFPIAILCPGSSLADNITSVIHFHRNFLKEFLDIGVSVMTLEQQGVDGNQININEFMEYYTRSNRLDDHRIIIEHLKRHPPKGWNGKLIFLGVSEGGSIVTPLTTDYPDITLATINWSGAGDFSWRDELWFFIQNMIKNTHWTTKLRAQLPLWMPYSLDLYFPKSRKDHDIIMNETIKNPCADLKIAGMTYKYHADALVTYPKPQYEKIKTPYLVVSGTKDSIIDSSDLFVQKAKKAGAPITYMRISDMNHYIRKREDIINDSFSWLKNQL